MKKVKGEIEMQKALKKYFPIFALPTVLAFIV